MTQKSRAQISRYLSFRTRRIRFGSLQSVLLGLILLSLPASAWAQCTSSATTLCLQSNRIQVTIDWEAGATSGQGLVTGPASNSFGFLRYDDSEAAEVLVKVLDACALNDHFWVLLASVSDAGQTVTVTDLNFGAQRQYFFTEGQYGTPVIDTAAFPCSMPFSGGGLSQEPARGSSSLSLAGGRFSAEVTWEDINGGTGAGIPLPILDRAGSFAFFTPSSPEMLVKIVPGVDFFTVAANATSDVAYDLVITDSCSGAVKTFSKPLGELAALVDDESFPSICDAIFTDDFESGDALSWSSVVGSP